MSLPTTAALLGALLAGSIIYLVRRDHLHGTQAVWWLLVAGAALLFGLFPSLVDRIGLAFGVQYPPMLMVILAIIAVLLKLVIGDIELARKERRLRRLTQKLAILEYEQDRAVRVDFPGEAEPKPRDNSVEPVTRGVDRRKRALG